MTTLVVWLWLLVSGLHVLVTRRFVARLLPADASTDERAFTTVLAGIGTLSIALHVVSVVPGLTLATGLLAVAIADGLLGTLAPRSHRADASPRPFASPIALAEMAAAVALVGVLLGWLDVASRSAVVTGTDAAHYHVPVAVNLALGGSLFDLPATQHLYPMAGSLLDAWFILPLGTPLVVDLAMCLPFLLTVTSANWIFRVTTGQSGLAWSSWLVLLLFSTPLFRASSLVSADLWFASAFMSLCAVLVSVWTRAAWRMSDVALGSAALGLLVGAKTTGVAAAALMLAAYVALEVFRRVRTRRSLTGPASVLRAGAVALALFLGSGGVWLVRNWLLFGSPIAPTGLTIFGVAVFAGEPFGPTTYLSVLGDIDKDASYDAGARTARYTRLWVGRWFVPALWLIGLVAVDVALLRTRGRNLGVLAPKLFFLALTAGVGGVLVYMLIGAPWTSLEWTRGFSLRYALPVVALAALMAFIAIFPASWRWYEHPSVLPGTLAALILLSGFELYSAMDPTQARYVNVPPATIEWLLVGLAVVVIERWLITDARLKSVVAVLAVVALASAWAPLIAARDAREYQRARDHEAGERADRARGVLPQSAAREVYFAVLDDEAAGARRCARRRFFALSRFDEPLMLQSYGFTNQVFYAGRDLDQTARPPALTPCDYVVTTRAVLETEKGKALVAALAKGSPMREISSAGSFLVLGPRQ